MKNKKEWVPETTFPVEHDQFFRADISVFYVSLGSVFEPGSSEEDVAVVRLMDKDQAGI